MAGQAATCLYTMYLLQAYQAELLGDHDEGGGCGQATDLSLRAMAALVATERHLWLKGPGSTTSHCPAVAGQSMVPKCNIPSR